MATLRTPRNTVQPMLAAADQANLATFVGDVVEDIRALVAALAGVHAQLDADATVNDTDYNGNDATQTALATLVQGFIRNSVEPRIFAVDTAWHAFTAAVLVDLTAIETAIEATTAKLDLDSGVTDTDYAATWDPASPTVTAESFAQFETRNPVAPMVLAEDIANIRTFSEECVVDLGVMRAAIVGITAKLDLDAGVTDTDYAANNDPAAINAADLTAS